MKRCLALAAKGSGSTAPNPMVGCVIVHKGKVIGEGFHKQAGEPHAEVHAISSVKDKALLRSSILYVNLEPCAHTGKTPPCVDLIIRYKIPYVVIGTIDPNPLVRGKGMQKLAGSGCDIKVGILEDECRELNRRFFMFHEKLRPYVVLKWAETADGYIGRADVRGKRADGKGRIQVSGSAAQKLVHSWRSEEQAIMVGTNTALYDNPRLTVRKVKGRSPVRVVIDKMGKVPARFHLLDGSVPTVIITSRKRRPKKNREYVMVDFRKDILRQVLQELHNRKIQSVLVEGGAFLLNSLIEQGLWDEARIFTSKKNLVELRGGKGSGKMAPEISGAVVSRKRAGKDRLTFLRNIS